MAYTNRILQYSAMLGGGMISAFTFASISRETSSSRATKVASKPLDFTTTSTLASNATSEPKLETSEIIQADSYPPETSKQLLMQQVTSQSLLPSLESASDSAVSLALRVSKFGLPGTENLRFRESYVASINYATKQPNFVCEYLTLSDLLYPDEVTSSSSSTSSTENKVVDRKHSKWTEDISVPKQFRSSTNDYWRSGLSRGHLAAAGNHNDTQLNKNDTFLLSSNIVPQDLSMNGCDWYRLETFVKNIVKSGEFDHCWVVSGPVFKNKDLRQGSESLNIRLIGGPTQNQKSQNLIPVPSHLFKVILCEKVAKNDVHDSESGSEYQIAAFLMANEPSASVTATPLTDYEVGLDQVEKWTGLQFFPKLLANVHVEDVEVVENEEFAENEEIEENGEKELSLNKILEKRNVFELCAKYGCVVDDNGRSRGWRQLGLLQTAKSFQVLDAALAKSLHDIEKEGNEGMRWMIDMNKRHYEKRKNHLIRYYTQKIEAYRQYVPISNSV